MKRIIYCVVGAHLLALIWIAIWTPVKKIEVKPIQVRTIVQSPPPPPPPKHTPAAVVKHTPAVSKPTAAKITPKKAPLPKQPISKATPVKKTPAIPENLMHQLQESIAKIEENSHKESPKRILEAPKQITTLKVDAVTTSEEHAFAAALVECLQSTLDLPEKGAVKVELTLKNDGSFVKMQILQSKSERNAAFLDQELQLVKYPGFTGSLKKEKEHAFVITFCNS